MRLTNDMRLSIVTDPLLTERGPGILGRIIVVALLLIPSVIMDMREGYSLRNTLAESGHFTRGDW